MLSTDTPWGESVMPSDNLVNYASNLAGLSETAKERIVREAQEIIAGKRAGFTPDAPEEISDGERLIGAIASAVFTAFTIPEMFNPRGALIPPLHTLLAGLVGGFLGYRYPIPVTTAGAILLVKQGMLD